MATASTGSVTCFLDRNFSLKITLIYLTLVSLVHLNVADNCLIGGYNASLLSQYNPWLTPGADTATTYKISLCEAVKLSNTDNDCPQNTAVCEQTKGGNSVSYGNHTTQINGTAAGDSAEMLVHYEGSPCPGMPGEYRTTIIYFKCGKSLGSPVFLGIMQCVVYFEWESHVFCTEQNDIHEVPCYLLDGNEKRDLSPLMKPSGAYLVDSTKNRQFYINVCRGVTGDASDPSSKCPAGSAACRIMDGQGEDMGQLTSRVQRTSGGNLMLHYTSDSKPDGCIDNPTTTITFICPKRGGSKSPLLIDDRLCQNVIEWETEYACAETSLTSDNCSLTQEQHNIDIDLSPLKKPLKAANPYKVNVTDGADHYVYVLNVCDKLGLECPSTSDNAAACQLKENHPDFSKNLGKIEKMKLRLSDNELSLLYSDGSKCHTNFRRKTFIVFKCNKTAANDGHGWPVYVKVENCTYFFEWQTKYACENHPVQGSCRVNYQQQRYDLSALVRENGGNWVALDGENQNDANQYYINVCKDVLPSPDTTGCTSTSVCRRDSTGKSVNLGQFTQGPIYEPKSKTIQITYTDGDACSAGKKITSRITFICKPGDLESGPVLVEKTDDECNYEFEWHSAAACVLSRKTGADCKVFDDDAGYSFDLTPLTKPDGEFYNVTDKNQRYDFLFNVCGPVSGTKCGITHTNPAMCQVDKNTGTAHVTGEVSKQLTYFDGMLKLTLTHGDLYNNEDKTPRQTQIAFLCDPTAKEGHPQFVMETNYTYSFKWYTAYACPTRPVECVYADRANNRLYDLSRLSMSEEQDNWVTLGESDRTIKRKFYINICRPISPVHLDSGSCSPFAAVCETEIKDGKEKIIHASLGEAKTGPVLDGDHPGQLRLKYTGGDPCVDENGQHTTMSTIIHFDCLKGSVSTSPSALIKTGQCEYSTIWQIETACPVDTVTANLTSCSIKDPNSEFVFNLKPLMKKNEGFYSVTSPDKTRTFRLNICGNVSASSCDPLSTGEKSAVCEVQGDVRNPALAMYSGELQFSDDGQLTLTYGGKRLISEQQVKVKIAFICRRNISVELPEFIRQEDQTYYFKFETPLACPPQPVDCVTIDDQGNEYNLNALAKTTSNWMIQDTRASHSNLKYYINICRPLNPIPGINCPGGPTGGCQVGDQSYSLGYVQSKPIAGKDGSLILEYRGGSLCHKGTNMTSYRSARINFICSHVESDPVFMGETQTCEYLFEWSTPIACPQQRSVGSGCKVTDPIYNYQFDLSPLHASEDYKVKVGEYTYLINVCGELNGGIGVCGGGNGVGACQTKPADASYMMNAGKANDKLIYKDGELILKYTDGKGNCHKKYNRTTIITFKCDHSKEEQGPRYLQEAGDCTYQFEWATSHACPPYTIANCMVTGPDNKMYDLSPLARSDHNYVYTEEYQRKKFVLNVCQTLVHQKGETCPPNSAACMIDLSETQPDKKYHNIGELSNNPVEVDHGTLILRYDNGEKCPHGNTTTSTVIIMNCDHQAFDTEPGGHFMVNQCEHHFVWTTNLACPVGSGVTPGVAGGNCTATNRNTGYTVDLSSLRRSQGYNFSDGNDHTFTFNVCGPLENSACGDNVGSCQVETSGEKRHFSSGLANSHLEFRGGFYMLNYSGGDTCHGKYQRATIISFICSRDVGVGFPVLVDETDQCVYMFNWHTSLVCEKEIPCQAEIPSADGNFTADLSPLIKLTGHHVAVSMLSRPGNHGATYFINICRPLNPIRGTLCPAGSSACMIEGDKAPVSLGRLHKGPFVNQEGKLTLLYDDGSPCDRNPSVNRTSRIIFTCQVGNSVGEPKFEAETGDCEYVFLWRTYLVCPPGNKPVTTPDCTYVDPRTDQKYDISALNTPVKINVPGMGDFYLQPCSGTNKIPQCPAAGSCLVNGHVAKSYGSAKSRMFKMQSREMLELQFSEGATCTDTDGADKKAKTLIYFQCDYSAGNGQPMHWPSDKCVASFIWKTALICPAVVEDCTLVYGGAVYDLEILSRETESWNYTDTKGNIYYMNICQGLHGRARGEGCHVDSAVCRKTADGQIDNIGSVKTQKLSMDADGKTIVLEYSRGEAACHRRRRSNSPSAKTIINFKCDKMIGGPRLVLNKDNDDSCVFEFEWKTRIACKDETAIQAVSENNGKVTDPKSNGVINLSKLTSTNIGNQVAYEKRGKLPLWYAISLNGRLNLDKTNGKAKECRGAAICQENQSDKSFHRNIGTYASRQYYFQDDQLEVVYKSPHKCMDAKDKERNKTVTSTIIFICDRQSNFSQPSFAYKSRKCSYLFNWYTDVVCLSPDVHVQTPTAGGSVDTPSGGGAGGSGGGIQAKTVFIIIAVFVSAILICIALVVFHKPERRIAFAGKMKRVFCLRKQTERHIKYSMLTQDDEDPEIDDDFFMDRDNDITTLPDVATSTNAASLNHTTTTQAQIQAYHDSSDDDMLQ